MFGPPRPRPMPYNMQWGQRPPFNREWRPNFRPRAPFQGQPHRFINNFRPPVQAGQDDYWCETCDRGFPTQDILNKHTQQHQTCNIDGCKFVAHPKVITKHIQMQHSSGLYKKIAKLNNPEEIEKWREERRKKYPTKANMEKKAAELKEKIDRGEKMGLERNTKYHNKDFKPGQGIKRQNNMTNDNHPGSKFRRDNATESNFRKNNPTEFKFRRNAPTDNLNKKPPPPKRTPKAWPPVKDSRKLNPFAGISSLEMDSDSEVEETSQVSDLIEDDDDETLMKTESTNEVIVCGALSSLMCEYGSSDDESNKPMTANLNDQDNKNIEKCNISKNEIIKTTEINSQALFQDNVIKNCDTSQIVDKARDLIVGEQNKTDLEQNHVTSEDVKLTNTLIVGEKTYTFKNNSNTCDSITKEEPKTALEKGNEVETQNDDDDSGPEEAKVVKSNDTTSNDPPKQNTKDKELNVRIMSVKRNREAFKRPKPKLPSTLLHKLLFKEMRQERNIVLQCIRYIRRNKFFDKEQ